MIPNNDEHMEALILEKQSEVDTSRAERKAKMSPEDAARLTLIEECTAKLEAARVPFMLCASAQEKITRETWIGWWIFHRLSYVPKAEPTAHYDDAFNAWLSLLPQCLDFLTTFGQATIVTHNSITGRALSVHRDGKCQMIPPPPPEVAPPATP